MRLYQLSGLFFGLDYSVYHLIHLIKFIPYKVPMYNVCLFIFLSLLLVYKFPIFSPLLILGLYASIYPLIPMDPFALTALSSKALLFTVIVFLTPKRLSLLFSVILLTNSLYVIFSPGHWGLGMATSVDAMIIAIMYPMFLKELSSYLNRDTDWVDLSVMAVILLIPIIALFIAGGSVGIGGLCLGLLIIYSRSNLMLVPIILFSIYSYMDPKLFSDSLRFICWEWSMRWWWDNANHWFGTGIGTYFVLGPYIQTITQQQLGNWYTLMHNDWLQLLFEFGYVGLTFITGAYLYLLYRVRNDRHILATVMVYGACALFYYPTKNILLACFAVSVIKDVRLSRS